VIQWHNLEYDTLVELARQEPDPKKRNELYFKIDDKLVKENVVVVPLYYASDGVLVSTRVKNFRYDPFGAQVFSEIRVP
jgi:ABC-type transport system substrate-binding protein